MSLVVLFCSLDPIKSEYASKIKFMEKENWEPDHISSIHFQIYEKTNFPSSKQVLEI